MLHKPFRTVLAALLVFGSPLIGLSGCEEDSAEQPSNPQAHGYAIGVMTGIPAEEFEAVEPEHRQTLIDRGSTFIREADGTYTWRFPYLDPRVSIAFGPLDPVTPSSTDASFTLPSTQLALKAAPARFFFEGKPALAPPPIAVVTRPDGVLEAQIQYDFSRTGCTCCKETAHGAPGRAEGVCGSCTACIDNNGIWAFWGCRTNRWVGFPGSDCSAAWAIYGLCGQPDNYCINGRNCSSLIRHSPCWHRL